MPHLAQGQTNNARILALHAVSSSGILYNPDSVEFRIMGPEGAQVYPVSGWEDVTTFGTATGIFPAWNTDLDEGWTPEVDQELGSYSIEWRFRDVDGVSVRRWAQSFWVSERGTGLPFWSYLSPNEVRDEGIVATTLTNERLLVLLRRVQAHIERACRQPFRPVAHTLKLDGDGGATLFFNVPIIGIESVKANYASGALAESTYRVYANGALGEDGGLVAQDLRRNPRISLVASIPTQGTIFTGSRRGGPRFAHATQAHEVKGVFGFVEADGQTPDLIRYAALRLVLANAPLIEVGSGSSGSGSPAGPVLSETTDRHSVTYADTSSTTSGPALGSALASSREVEEILQGYRSPIVIGAPATAWSTLLGP